MAVPGIKPKDACMLEKRSVNCTPPPNVSNSFRERKLVPREAQWIASLQGFLASGLHETLWLSGKALGSCPSDEIPEYGGLKVRLIILKYPSIGLSSLDTLSFINILKSSVAMTVILFVTC